MDPDAWLKTLYAAMKPGATVGVIDHVASPNSDVRATVEKYHRIDPEVVKADFKRAGFVLEGTSDILRNPADDHSLLVFDPKIRGKTDRTIFEVQEAPLSLHPRQRPDMPAAGACAHIGRLPHSSPASSRRCSKRPGPQHP